ncbi:hypothetical protein [Streptomyces sp. NPDC058745]|uniref:hypothetical protein n=1 Tax=Streptomyces sp. NPDC058745 TaxID=3346621 RepID=UPI0036739F36
MNQDLEQDLAEYRLAVARSNDLYKGISPDERIARQTSARMLNAHQPAADDQRTCTGCDERWPCVDVKAASAYSDPLNN